ncbi:hypothetical protein AB0B42_08235 [Streptomyces fradiae]
MVSGRPDFGLDPGAPCTARFGSVEATDSRAGVARGGHFISV